MKPVVPALILQIGLATSAIANPIVVRSGEHENFSRLVMQLPASMTWQLNKSDRGYVLELSDTKATFDVVSVFQRIPKNRIRDIVPVGSRLNIEIECDCAVEGFLERNRLLLIDVVDSAEQPEEPNQVAETAAVQETPRPTVQFGYGDLLWESQTPQAALALDVQVEPEPVYDPRPITRVEPSFANRSASVTATEERLLKAIGQAATQGLLTPAEQAKSAQADVPVEEPASDIDVPEHVSESAEGKPLRNRQNIKVTGSLDVENPNILGDTEVMKDGIVCPNDAVADVGSWGTKEPFGLQIGQLRSVLVGEFDRANSDAITALAKAYLYFGFGAEAKRVIEMSTLQKEENAILVDIADILELGHTKKGSETFRYANCDGPIALWATLSVEVLPPEENVNSNAALLALNDLPRHLREYVGPILSTRFQQHGDTRAASAAIRIIDRVPVENPAPTQLAKAQISLDEGKVDDAQESLTTVVQENTELSPMALVDLVDLSLEQGLPISDGTVLLVDAYERQYRKDPENAELKRVQILSLAMSQQFSKAFEAISKIEPQARRSQLELAVLPLLTKNAGDIEFLKHALRISASNQIIDSVDVLENLTKRLAENGFYAEAASLLDRVDAVASNRERRLFRANLALEMEQPRRAEAELIGLSGPDVDVLIAEAREQLGDFEASAILYKSANVAQAADRTALFSNNWDVLENSQQPELQALATLIKNQGLGKEEPERSTRPLADGRDLLENSSSTRETLRTLLDSGFNTDSD